jgi:hypothetical protein
MRRPATVRLSMVLGAACALASAAAYGQICSPPSTPCQQCPSPPPCPAPTDPTCGGFRSSNGSSNTTFSTSTVSCSGSFAQNTVTVENAIGPANICVGPQKSIGCAVASGTQNFNANTDSIFAGAVLVPALSIWGLGALVVGLGALALRRLRLRPPAS